MNLAEVKTIYRDLSIQKNSDHEIELGFKTESTALKFVEATSVMSVIYRDDRFRYSMQFIADILKRLHEDQLIVGDDLYHLKESEVIDLIGKSKYHDIFETWQRAKEIKVSPTPPDDVYSVHCAAKVRYINPLFAGQRLADINQSAKAAITRNLAYKMDNYCYLDFDFPA